MLSGFTFFEFLNYRFFLRIIIKINTDGNDIFFSLFVLKGMKTSSHRNVMVVGIVPSLCVFVFYSLSIKKYFLFYRIKVN